ncbi:MAG: hypothetical protein NXH72_15270 [Hyphomonadaceae bacterium]|nr:hypothetical protein [Hyphomonadaceae bacterium]
MPRIPFFALLASLGLTTACASAPLTLNDNRIVPGERVGDVEIGMTLDQLLALKGVPERTIPMRGTAATTYVFDGMTVGAHDTVYWIIVQDDRFRTAEGITKGSEQISARAVFGVPDCVVSKAESTIYDYGNIYFHVENDTGRVEMVGIMAETQNCNA